VRNEGLFEFALASPKNLLAYREPAPDIVPLAAARTFLLLNGRDISADPEEKYVAMISLAEGKLSE
jgi:prophage maintenance system killer protein